MSWQCCLHEAYPHEHQNQYVCPVLTHQTMKTLAQPVSQLVSVTKLQKLH